MGFNPKFDLVCAKDWLWSKMALEKSIFEICNFLGVDSQQTSRDCKTEKEGSDCEEEVYELWQWKGKESTGSRDLLLAI